jgi:hypothetical protein
MALEPSREFLLVLDLNEYTVCSSLTSAKLSVCVGERIHNIDPIDEGLLIPKDQGRSIEHDLGTGMIPSRSRTRSRSCRACTVFVDQPIERVAPLDRIGSR